MAETIAGGAYLHTDGKTWLDAEGRPLSKESAAEAQAKLAEQQEAAARVEASAQQQEALARESLRRFLLQPTATVPAVEDDETPRRGTAKPAKAKE